MTQGNLTVQDLLGVEKLIHSSQVRAAIETTPAAAELKKALGTSKSIRLDGVYDAAMEKIPDLLNMRVLDILVASWRKYELLAKYTDPHRYSPEETILCPLADHTVKSEHHPCIEILVNGKPQAKVSFDVTLSLHLETVELRIQDAKIKAVDAGKLSGSGEIAFGAATLLQKDFGPIALPGCMDLGVGISLRGLAAAG